MKRILVALAIGVQFLVAPTALAQTPPPGTASTIGGSGIAMVPQGKPGILDVVAVGPYANGDLPFIVRNNTGAAVADFTVTADAHDASGKSVATGELPFGIELSPSNVSAGGIAFGNAVFLGVVPNGVTFTVTVSAKPAPGSNIDIVDLDVPSVTSTGTDVSGTLHNPTNVALGKPFVTIACLDAHGALTGVGSPMVDLNLKQPDANGDVTFDVPVSTTPIQGDCTNEIVAAYAHHR
ncbi:MAG: FxLYD domain-containing protein [Thermomicrobiales bacterium]